MAFPEDWFGPPVGQTITVEPLLGSSPYGATFGPPVELDAFVDDAQDVIVQGTTVAITDQTKIYTRLSAVGVLTTDSRVTVDGEVVRVESVKRRSSGGLLPDHLEVTVR